MSSDESSDESSSAASVVAYEDNTNYDDDDSSSTSNDNNGQQQQGEKQDNDELSQLKSECRAMVTLLKRLRREEEDLRQKNCMLARQAVLCGFQVEALESAARPPPKRRSTVNKQHVVRKDHHEGKAGA